jgi:hypothetical protein
VWPSCQRISSWLGGSEESEPRFFRLKKPHRSIQYCKSKNSCNSTNHQSPRQLVKCRQNAAAKNRRNFDEKNWRFLIETPAILPFCVYLRWTNLLSKPKFNKDYYRLWSDVPFFGKTAIRRVRKEHFSVYNSWKKPKNCVFCIENAHVEPEVRGLNLDGFVPFFRVKTTTYYDPNVCILKKISNLKYDVCK